MDFAYCMALPSVGLPVLQGMKLYVVPVLFDRGLWTLTSCMALPSLELPVLQI